MNLTLNLKLNLNLNLKLNPNLKLNLNLLRSVERSWNPSQCPTIWFISTNPISGFINSSLAGIHFIPTSSGIGRLGRGRARGYRSKDNTSFLISLIFNTVPHFSFSRAINQLSSSSKYVKFQDLYVVKRKRFSLSIFQGSKVTQKTHILMIIFKLATH